MSFSLQSLAHDTRSNVPTSALLDHFKAATVGATGVAGGANSNSHSSSNSSSHAGGSEHPHLSDRRMNRSSTEQPAAQLKAKTANIRNEGAWMSERVAPGCIIDLDYDDDGWENGRDAHHASDSNGYDDACAGGASHYQYRDEEDSLSRTDFTSYRQASSPCLRSPVSSSSSTTHCTSRQSDGPQSDDISLTETHYHPLLTIPTGLTAISAMTRTLRLWVKTWSAGRHTPDTAISSTYDTHADVRTSDVRHSVNAKPDKILFPPSDEQCSVLISYGVQLLVEQKPDFAVAYVRTLARLVYNMRSLLTAKAANTADSHCPIRDTINASRIEESQRWSGEERGSEGEPDTMTSLLWQAVRQWEMAAYQVEKAVQTKAVQLYGAILIVSTSHS